MSPRPPHHQPLGVVLAGGDSRRFGRDKTSLLLRGETLVQRACDLLLSVCSEVVLADRGRQLLPAIPSVEDGAGSGPAAGILGAAAVRPARWLLVLACDLPAVPASLLEALRDRVEEGPQASSWVPRHGGAGGRHSEPLCALYRPEDLSVLARRVGRGALALHGWLADGRARIRFLEGEDLLRHGAPEEVFVNLNRPQDLERLAAGGAGPSTADGQEDVGQ